MQDSIEVEKAGRTEKARKEEKHSYHLPNSVM
jgi:hypothetical protein